MTGVHRARLLASVLPAAGLALAASLAYPADARLRTERQRWEAALAQLDGRGGTRLTLATHGEAELRDAIRRTLADLGGDPGALEEADADGRRLELRIRGVPTALAVRLPAALEAVDQAWAVTGIDIRHIGPGDRYDASVTMTTSPPRMP